MGGQKNTSDAKVYHIEGAMQNTQSGWTEEHKLYKITIPIGGQSIKSTQNKAGDISDTKVVLIKTLIDIKISAHDSFLEYPSSGTLKVERLESQINKKNN